MTARHIPATPEQRARLLKLGVGGNLGTLSSIQADRLIAELGGDEFSGFEPTDPAVPVPPPPKLELQPKPLAGSSIPPTPPRSNGHNAESHPSTVPLMTPATMQQLRARAYDDQIREMTPAEAPRPSTVASVPFMLTAAMKLQLRELGYTDEAIREMTPSEAHRLLNDASPQPSGNAESAVDQDPDDPPYMEGPPMGENEPPERDAPPRDPDVNIDRWLRGEVVYEGGEVLTAATQRFHKRYIHLAELVLDIIDGKTSVTITEREIHPSVMKIVNSYGSSSDESDAQQGAPPNGSEGDPVERIDPAAVHIQEVPPPPKQDAQPSSEGLKANGSASHAKPKWDTNGLSQEHGIDAVREMSDQAKTLKARTDSRDRKSQRSAGSTSTTGTDEWPELDRSLVDEDRSPPPEFDWDALPPAWIDWIKETAEDCGAPPDYVAGTLIATTSAVIGNSRRVSPRELWVEQPHLWLALVGAPSTNKTVALAPFKSACSAIEKDSAGAYDKAVKNYTERKEVADAAQREWQSAVKDAVKNGNTPPPLPDSARQPDKPIPPRVMISDASTEEVGALLAGNLHGLVLVRSELSGWLGQFDRYSGAGADRAFYLEAWDGGSHVIDRVKFSGVPLRVPYASLAIVGSLQPDHLSKVFRGIDDGLAARFLYVWPSPVAPKRPDRPNPKNHIKTLQDAFKQLRKLGWGRDDYGDQIPLIMRLDEAALEILHKVQMEVFTANQIRGAGIMAGWRGKNPGRLLRIALGFEFLEWVVRGGAEPTTISGDMTARAADFLQYCTAMMRHALRDLLITDVQRDAAKLARFIESEAPQTINEREVYKREGFHSLRNDKAHRDKVFAALEEAGWIRRVSNGATGGRPRGDWTVSPKVRRAGV